MNEEIFKGSWEEMKGKIKTAWGKLTDDDMTKLKGDHQQIHGLLQKHYGYTKDQAAKAVKDFGDTDNR